MEISDMVTLTVNMINKTLIDKKMKEKIIEIIGSVLEPVKAEQMANEIIINFNDHLITTLKNNRGASESEILHELFINL